MKRNSLLLLPLLLVPALAGCGQSEKKQEVDKSANVERYEKKAAEMGRGRDGGRQGGGTSDPNVTGPPR